MTSASAALLDVSRKLSAAARGQGEVDLEAVDETIAAVLRAVLDDPKIRRTLLQHAAVGASRTEGTLRAVQRGDTQPGAAGLLSELLHLRSLCDLLASPPAEEDETALAVRSVGR